MLLVSCSSLGPKMVSIGRQVWAAENLNVERFRNGDPIPEATTDSAWIKAELAGEPAWCFLDNSRENGRKYGRIYNYYAIMDPRGLAPAGWRIPTYHEWIDLFEECGGTVRSDIKGMLTGGDTVAMALKSKTGWGMTRDSVALNGDDTYGWRALPGGTRNPNGSFDSHNWVIYWSSSLTEYGSDHVWMMIIGDYFRRLQHKRGGAYVRCIKE